MKLETPEFVLHASERLQALWHRKYGPAVCIGTAAALVLCVGAVAVWAGGRGSNAASEVPEPSATPWVEPASDADYDAAAGVIDTTAFTGTVLPQTEDAGEEYVKETLFLGDSNTVRYMMYGKCDLTNAIGVTSMSAGQITSLKCVDFKGYSSYVTIPEAVKIMHPRRVIVSFGSNNLGGGTENYIDAYQKGLAAIHEAYPYADIIVNAVPPLDKLRENTALSMTQVDSFNQALVKMCEEKGYKFLNSSEALKDANTGWAKTDYTLSDGVHLSMNGVNALFDYIRTHAYITKDTRPTPLSKVPERNETPVGLITSDPIAVRGQKVTKVSVEFSAGEGGKIQGSTVQEVAKGATCSTVTAVAEDGWKFSYWSAEPVGSCGGSETLTFVVPQDADASGIMVQAHFERVEPEATATPSPTPTATPTATPTQAPTAAPTEAPTPEPTEAPTPEPTAATTETPTEAPPEPEQPDNNSGSAPANDIPEGD